MSIRVSKFRNYYISVDKVAYDKSDVEKYLDTVTIKENSKSRKTTLPHDMLFTKEDAYTNDNQVNVLSRD